MKHFISNFLVRVGLFFGITFYTEDHVALIYNRALGYGYNLAYKEMNPSEPSLAFLHATRNGLLKKAELKKVRTRKKK